MSRRPNRIHRDIGLDPAANLLEVTMGGRLFTGAEVTALTITRGTGSPVGLAPSTATVDLAGWWSFPVRTWDATAFGLDVRLSQAAADHLAATTGAYAPGIIDRFTGAVRSATVTDRGTGRPASTRYESTDWLGFLPDMDDGARVASSTSTSVNQLYASQFGRARGRGLPLPAQSDWGSAWGTAVLPEGDTELVVSTSDTWGKFCADLGHYVFADRSGVPTCYAIDHRADQVQSRPTFWPQAMARRHVLAPLRYKSTAAIRALVDGTVMHLDRTTEDLPDPSNPALSSRTHLDLTHVYDSQYVRQALVRRRNRSASIGFTMPLSGVTFDLLALARRGGADDLAWIKQLLTFHTGEAIGTDASFDGLRWIYFITRITERIARDEWTISLDLAPDTFVTPESAPTRDGTYSWDGFTTSRDHLDPFGWDDLTTTWADETPPT